MAATTHSLHEHTTVTAAATREERGRNPNLGERRSCHVSSFQ